MVTLEQGTHSCCFPISAEQQSPSFIDQQHKPGAYHLANPIEWTGYYREYFFWKHACGESMVPPLSYQYHHQIEQLQDSLNCLGGRVLGLGVAFRCGVWCRAGGLHLGLNLWI